MEVMTVHELRKALDALENAGKIDGASIVLGHVPATNEVMLPFEVRLMLTATVFPSGRRSAPERSVRILLARQGDPLHAET